MDSTTHPAFERSAAAVADLFGEQVDEEMFAVLVDLALAEVDRRALAGAEPAATYVVVGGRRVYDDGSSCPDWPRGGERED